MPGLNYFFLRQEPGWFLAFLFLLLLTFLSLLSGTFHLLPIFVSCMYLLFFMYSITLTILLLFLFTLSSYNFELKLSKSISIMRFCMTLHCVPDVTSSWHTDVMSACYLLYWFHQLHPFSKMSWTGQTPYPSLLSMHRTRWLPSSFGGLY